MAGEDQGTPDSARDELSAAFDKIIPDTPASSAPAAAQSQTPATPAAATPSTPVASSPKEPAATGGSEQPGKGIDRGDGRDVFGNFAPKNADGTPKTAAQTAAEGQGTPPAGQPAPGAAQPATDGAPVSWKPEFKAHWDKVPAELRPYMHQREGELARGFQEVASARSAASAVLGEFAPYAEQLQRENTTPVQAIRTLLQTAHSLRTGGNEYRKAIILNLAQQYGVDLSAPYNAQLATAEAQAAQLATERMYGQASVAQRQEQEAVAQFHAFANDPANEFFAQVRVGMSQLLGSGVAQDMKSAYDMACWNIPQIRNELIRRQQSAPPTPLDARRQAAAGMSVSGSPSSARMAQADAGSGDDLRTTLEKQFAAL